ELVDDLLLEIEGRHFLFPRAGIEDYEIIPSKGGDSIRIVNNQPSNAVLVAKNLSNNRGENVQDVLLCDDQPSDRILMSEYYARFGIVAKDYPIVDSITTYVQEVYETINGEAYPKEKHDADSLLLSYQKNISVDYWNYAIPLFEEWDSLKQIGNDYYERFQRNGVDSLYRMSYAFDSLAQRSKENACLLFERAWELDSLNEDRIDARIWCEARPYTIQIAIASSRQQGTAREIQTLIKESNYEVQRITTDASIRTSEIVYFYEEDRYLAYRLLKKVSDVLVDENIKTKKETPPFGPGEPRKGEVIIRLANQDIPSIPSTGSNNTPFTIAFYAYRYSNAQYQAVNDFLLSQSYELNPSRLVSTPFEGMTDRSTIFYYSDNGRTEATRLSAILEKRFGYNFQVRAGAGEINNRSFDKNKGLIIHFIGEEEQSNNINERFPILSGMILKRISRNPNIRIQWLNPSEQRIESNGTQYRIELGITSNQELATGNLWIEHNGRILENKKESISDQNARRAIRYTYGYNRTIDLVEGNNVLKFLVINE
ncbi:MAG: hypothetical protein AAFO82_16815, partial [Bacteroidota bacterium]